MTSPTVPDGDRPAEPLRLTSADRRAVLGVAAFALVQSAFAVPSLIVVRHLLDTDARSGWGSFLLGVLLAGLVVGGLALQTVARSHGLAVVQRFVGRARHALAGRLSALDRGEVAGGDVDQLHASVVYATERLERAATSVLAGLIPGAIVVLVVGGALVLFAPLLAVTLFVCSLPAVAIARMQRGRMMDTLARFHRSLGRYSGAVWDALRLRDLISAAGAERQIETRLAAEGDETGACQRDANEAQLRYVAGQHAVLGAAGAVALGIGAALVSTGNQSSRDLVTLVAAFGLIQSSLRLVTGSIPQLVEGQSARRTLTAFLAAGPPAPPPAAAALPAAGRQWELRDIRFRYSPDGPEVLDGVDLVLRRGSIVGIQGPNGSGKTTLVALLMAWYRPESGSITIDGIDTTELEPAAIRALIGLVPQDPEFLDASVIDNLTLGLTPAPSSETVAEALQLATADAVIVDRPGGLEQLMGRDGRHYSGGQRQRLAIARALLRRPALLIVDEPTSHLDPASATVLLVNLRRSVTDQAVLVVSHDPAVLAICDEVHRLEHGRIGPPLLA